MMKHRVGSTSTSSALSGRTPPPLVALALAATAALTAGCDAETRSFGDASSGGGVPGGGGAGGGGAGGGAVAGECQAGETRCRDGAQETCANGRWGDPATCRFGCGGAACITVGEMSLGRQHTCARLTDGTVHCWGSSQFGQLGDGTSGDGAARPRPGPVVGLSDIAQISAGDLHTCALRTNGTATCWGHNGFGNLGNGGYETRPTATDVRGLVDAAGVASGRSHGCAWLTDGTAQCWGYNPTGQLGTGGTADSPTPATVTALSGTAALSLGDVHTCALSNDGTAMCWGDNSYGQLGDGTAAPGVPRPSPGTVPGLGGVAQLALGFTSSCARFANGGVSCWGDNSQGQLGDGSRLSKSVPTPVPGLGGVRALASGASHACALVGDGGAVCWGNGVDGQLGDGSIQMSQGAPVAVKDLRGAVGIAAGGAHSCAWFADGKAVCWGNNDAGQIGDGTTGGSRSLPTEVTW